jgi:hypothetical protein
MAISRPAPVKRAPEVVAAYESPLQRSRRLLAEHEKGLAIDKTRLDEELSQHPERYYHAGREHAFAVSYRDQAKLELAQTEARADASVRLEAKASTDRVTEAVIQAKIVLTPNVVTAHENLRDWTRVEMEWRALTQAISDRRWVMADLIKWREIQYFDASIKGASERTIGDRAAAEVRRNGD